MEQYQPFINKYTSHIIWWSWKSTIRNLPHRNGVRLLSVVYVWWSAPNFRVLISQVTALACGIHNTMYTIRLIVWATLRCTNRVSLVLLTMKATPSIPLESVCWNITTRCMLRSSWIMCLSVSFLFDSRFDCYAELWHLLTFSQHVIHNSHMYSLYPPPPTPCIFALDALNRIELREKK